MIGWRSGHLALVRQASPSFSKMLSSSLRKTNGEMYGTVMGLCFTGGRDSSGWGISLEAVGVLSQLVVGLVETGGLAR